MPLPCRAAALLALAAIALAGCESKKTELPALAPAPIMDESVPQVARDACLAEVAKTTANQDVAIVEMIFSEANSDITIGVGPDRARWRCLVSSGGIVGQVTSLTDEGAL